jgi:hypothetical protein
MKKYICRILSLNAYSQTEKNGDEVFLKVGDKKLWPVKEKFNLMREGKASINMDIKVERPGETIELALMEYDGIFKSTCIGNFSLDTSSAGGPFTTDIRLGSGEYARYSLRWELVLKLNR